VLAVVPTVAALAAPWAPGDWGDALNGTPMPVVLPALVNLAWLVKLVGLVTLAWLAWPAVLVTLNWLMPAAAAVPNEATAAITDSLRQISPPTM
jgi:hypothetical protein